MAANACGRRVVTGPIEATAIGNLMQQLIANGDVGSISDARQIIANSFDLTTYEPEHASVWNEAYPRFLEILQ